MLSCIYALGGTGRILTPFQRSSALGGCRDQKFRLAAPTKSAFHVKHCHTVASVLRQLRDPSIDVPALVSATKPDAGRNRSAVVHKVIHSVVHLP